MKINIKELKTLDNKLRTLENKFQKDLDKYYSNLESDALKQVTRFKKTGKIKVKDSRKSGLNNLFKEYFSEVEKTSEKYTKRELLRDFQGSKDQSEILKTRIEKRSKRNIKYAEKLANKQVDDFERNLTETLKSQVKDNKKISSKELKQIARQKSTAFKNQRVKATAGTEANRVTNDVRLSIYKDLDKLIKAIIFTAVLDTRTTEICRSRNGVVLSIKDPKISEFTPPLHVYCRSYWRFIKLGSKKRKSQQRTISKIINNAPKMENKLIKKTG